MGTLLKDYSRGCGRSVVIRLLATLIVIPLGCAFIFVPMWLVTSLDMPIWILIVSSFLFLVIIFGGGAAYVAWTLYQRKQKLDAAFAPLGLEGTSYQMWFRQYHGTFGGRQVDLYFRRGPVLTVEIDTPLQTRLGVTGQQGDTLALARLFGREALAFDDPALHDLTVFGLDEAWACSTLAHPEAAKVLHRLTALEGFFTRQQVILRPGHLQLLFSGNRNMFGFDLPPEHARAWLEDLVRLAEIAESLPAPQVTAEESAAERMAESVRNTSPYLMPLIVVGTVVGILLCSGVIAAAVFLLSGVQ
jgi:hypothetical protein